MGRGWDPPGVPRRIAGLWDSIFFPAGQGKSYTDRIGSRHTNANAHLGDAHDDISSADSRAPTAPYPCRRDTHPNCRANAGRAVAIPNPTRADADADPHVHVHSHACGEHRRTTDRHAYVTAT